MKSKSIPYLDQLLELGKLYKVDELKFYAKLQSLNCRETTDEQALKLTRELA